MVTGGLVLVEVVEDGCGSVSVAVGGGGECVEFIGGGAEGVGGGECVGARVAEAVAGGGVGGEDRQPVEFAVGFGEDEFEGGDCLGVVAVGGAGLRRRWRRAPRRGWGVR